MSTPLKYRDLDEVTVDDGHREVIGAGDEPERKSKPSILTILVKAADEQATDDNRTPDTVSGRDVMAGPWMHLPKDRKPAYFRTDLTKVRTAYGAKSPYAREHSGVHFQFKLGDTIDLNEGTGKRARFKGTIYCRKIFPLSPTEGTN